MIIKSSRLHWGLIFPQGFLRSWTGNVLQKKNNFCLDLSHCKKVQLQRLQHSSVTDKNNQNWCKREKSCFGSHKETAHSVPEWLCGPCWAEFPWIISLCLGILGSWVLNSMEKSFWEPWWCPVLCACPHAQHIYCAMMPWCYFWKFLRAEKTPWVWGQAGETEVGT